MTDIHDPFPPTDFWQQRLAVNSGSAIFHQWQQLETTGCIDNFRITAGLKEGFREGFFFADSDAYKWLDAAARIYARSRDTKLKALIDEFAGILVKAQAEDGYLYTFNQVFYPERRWDTLQVGHELYCIGHLIEAGISHHIATAKESLAQATLKAGDLVKAGITDHVVTGEEYVLQVALKAADLLLGTFMDAEPVFVDGHEEIEIALMELSRHTGDPVYRKLARRFLERRGSIKGFTRHFITETLRMAGRVKHVTELRKQYYQAHPQQEPNTLPRHNQHKIPLLTPLRFLVSALSGRYTQQHAPLNRQINAEGHAVRFTYLNTAAAMLANDEQDDSLRETLERTWQSMTERRMYVTGGLGALPLIEGFGRDAELPPESAYAETCAALGSLSWNREMGRLTHEAKYEDLFEWQLYNAALVGMGLDGKSYFYNNPLSCRGGLERAAWYDVPCCPSNLSRTLAALAGEAISTRENEIRVQQYTSGEYPLPCGTLAVKSALPWEGRVLLKFTLEQPAVLRLHLRVPAWTRDALLSINGEEQPLALMVEDNVHSRSVVDLHFEQANYAVVERVFQDGDQLELRLSMPLLLRRMDKRIPGCGGKVALTRGPLVYCLESPDNPAEIFRARIDPRTLHYEYRQGFIGGTGVVEGISTKGEVFRWIPYFLWGNRGASKMTVFFNTEVN